jgi:nitrate reductase NapE component
MHTPVNHRGAPSHARHKPAGELSAWIFDAMLLFMVFTIIAVGLACGVLLLVT